MKINNSQLGELLLQATLSQYVCVPAENELTYRISEEFQEKIRNLGFKSDSVLWRTWHTPVKRAVLIAVMVALLLVTVACAVPAILNPSIEFDFLEKTGGFYGIIFDPEALANAPQTLEEIYVPTYEPKGFELIEDTAESYGVTYIWTNEEEEVICFDQRALPENPNDTDWLFINSEDTERSLLIENGYMVQIVANKERAQYIGVWTDNRYLYLVTISVFDEDPEPILREIMNSLVQIEKKT